MSKVIFTVQNLKHGLSFSYEASSKPKLEVVIRRAFKAQQSVKQPSLEKFMQGRQKVKLTIEDLT